MNELHINDTDYGPAEVRELREEVIKLRDEALKNNDFKASVVLSVNIALLAAMANMLSEKQQCGSEQDTPLDLL